MRAFRKRILVDEFDMPWDDDPMIWVGGPISDWNKTPKGQWIMANTKPSYSIRPRFASKKGYTVRITAELDEKKLTYYYLRWPA